MKSVQSMILGEPDKDNPDIAPSSIKTVERPFNNTSSMPNELALNEHSSDGITLQSNGQVQHEKSQSTLQSNAEQQPPKQANSLTDVIDAMYKSRMPTEEELKKERKRERAKQIISAIADGTSAIANLYFAGKGAKNVKQTSMSAANAKRYQNILDRRRKMQDKWDDARLAAYDRDRGFNYQKDRDDANWKRSGEWHKEQVTTDNERYKDTKDRNKVLDEFNIADRDRNYELHKKAQENQEKAQKDASARGWASHGLQKKTQEDSVRIQEGRIRAMGGKIRGKRIGFSDGSGNDVGIYENVWKGSMQQVFDVLSKDFRPDKMTESMWNLKINKMTSREKEDFVKQNWTKSPRASAIMKTLSQIDPAVMDGDLVEEDPYAKYTTGDDPYAKYAE